MNDELIVMAKHLREGSCVKVKVICDYCGQEYETQYLKVIQNKKNAKKDACSHCNGLKASELSRNKRSKKKFNELEKICKINNYKLLSNIDDYVDVKMKIKFLCQKHGEQSMTIDNLLRGHKCIKCSYEKRRNDLKYSSEYVESIINDINENILLNPQDYKNVFTHNLKIKCKCGNTFITSLANYKKHNVNKCFSCSNKESNAELRIKKYLNKQHITFIQEKRFSDCRDLKPLPFDFYLPQHNLAIEFDGQHHFKQIRDKKQYYNTIKHDNIKNNYCELHSISLLRIPYWKGNDIEKIIANELKL